ncbi:MAG TPA: ABC transporter permease [Candidatus Pelethocola excrementipullorum]|nr:ABC transporter permease [Candidatus Pelethocola excrementipullorum]
MEKIQNRLRSSDKNSMMLFLIAVVIFLVMGILEPSSFLGIKNIQGMCTQLPEFGLIAFGMMLAMISGGIDLSLVGIANFAGIVSASIIVRMGGGGFSILAGCIAAIVVGAVCGCFNGFMIGYLQIPAMLVTLCGLQLYTGCGLMITKGPAITGLPEAYSFLGNGMILGVPVAFLIFIAAGVVVYFLLRSTIYGQHVRYMGTNSMASRYSGINNLAVTIKTYMMSGILGSLAGLIMVSRYNSAKTDYGSSYTLLSLLIVVLGGTNPDGGKGSAIGVFLSVVVLQLVSSAFNIMRVDSSLKTFVWGVILIIVIVAEQLGNKRRMRNA